MECRRLDIIVVSAKNLPNVRNNGKMKVFAEVSINGDSKTAKRSTIDRQRECNPIWNSTITYAIWEGDIRQSEGVDIIIKLICDRRWGNRYIGEVKLAVKDLFDNGASAHNMDFLVGGTAYGMLRISYEFGEKFLVPQPRSGRGKTTSFMGMANLQKLIFSGTKVGISLLTGGVFDVVLALAGS